MPGQYRLLALGQRSAVPAPFSARILGPAMAGWLGRVTGLGVDTGFLLLGIVCLVALIALVAGLLWSWRAPIGDLCGEFSSCPSGSIFSTITICPTCCMPPSSQLFCYASLRLHTDWPCSCSFPPTWRASPRFWWRLCLIFACWRRIPLRSAAIGVLAMVCGGLVSRHYGQSRSRQRPRLERRGLYPGQTLLEFLQECSRAAPLEQYAAGVQPHLGHSAAAVPSRRHSSGRSCASRPSGDQARLLLAWFGIFGIGPALAVALWRKMVPPSPVRADKLTPGMVIVFRFCIVYGVISILMTPLLGRQCRPPGRVWVAVLLCRAALVYLPVLRSPRHPSWPGLLLLHLLTCWLAWFGFRQQTPGFLFAGLVVLALNGVGYALFRRS